MISADKKFPGRLAWVVIASMAVWLNLAHAEENDPSKGDGAKAEAVVVITNQKYNHNCFWAGPKGVKYGNLPNAQPIQKPVLYPDVFSTYFVAQFTLPEDAHLTIKGDFPHERYFSFTVANLFDNGQIGNGSFLRDDQINADEGSANPFQRPPNNRDPEGDRSYTVYVVPGAPSDRKIPRPDEKNRLYVGKPGTPIFLAMRNYVNDKGYDGTGNAKVEQVRKDGLPEVTLVMSGQSFTGDEMCRILQTTRDTPAKGLSVEQWLELVAFSGDAVNAPATSTPVWEIFWDVNYSVIGAFTPDPVTREAIYPATGSGGFANNPDTRYLSSTFSLDFGSVVVIQGKMPTFPHTKNGEKTWPDPPPQLRYWSACTGGAPPSGAGWDCVYDEMVPLGENRMYMLVVSRPEDRPTNATEECGVKWLDFGPGEDIPRSKGGYEGARPWVNFVYFRYMDPSDDWEQSPANVPLPTSNNPYPQESYVMKEYFPSSHYETTAQFESHGCPTNPPPRLPRK